jgi:hypothetical protein
VAIDPKVIDTLKAEHSQVYLLAACDEQVIVRQPTKGEFERFAAAVADEARRAKASRLLFLDCVVYPDREAVDAMLARLPGLAITFGGECAELAGVTRDVERKKL